VNHAGRSVSQTEVDSRVDVYGLVLDLDDTLFPQRDWLEGACEAVTERAGEWGIDKTAFRAALTGALAAGSDRGDTIDRALAAIGASMPVDPLVKVFRAHAPPRLEPFPGVGDCLRHLAGRVPLVVVSDGAPATQRAKLAATGLTDLFTSVVLSDELGREHRKPDPLPFLLALEAMGLRAGDVVAIGDRPDKDVAGALRAGLRAIRVRTGEYADRPDLPGTWAVCDSLSEVVGLLEGRLARQQVPPP
jgi:FMN phosphatase YigB (HAD superfamily)